MTTINTQRSGGPAPLQGAGPVERLVEAARRFLSGELFRPVPTLDYLTAMLASGVAQFQIVPVYTVLAPGTLPSPTTLSPFLSFTAPPQGVGFVHEFKMNATSSISLDISMGARRMLNSQDPPLSYSAFDFESQSLPVIIPPGTTFSTTIRNYNATAAGVYNYLYVTTIPRIPPSYLESFKECL